MATAVANRYARALADLVAEDSGHAEPLRMVEELRAFEEALAAAEELSSVLANPAVPPPRKRAVVARLADMMEFSPLVRNLLYVLIDRRRIGALQEIREAFEEMLDERLGLLRADVISAGELSEEQREKLRNKLSSVVGKQVRCEYVVDADLLGGAVVHLASTVYDGSVRGRLEALRHKLVE